MNPAANGECGPWQQPAFGQALSAAPINPEILEGWGVRPSDWQFGASVQHEVLPRTSVEVGYHRRWFQGFLGDRQPGLDTGRLRAVHVHGTVASVASRGRWLPA